MEAFNIQFAPATGTEQEWNEAYERLADYFRAHRLHHRIRRTQLILETLSRAADAHAKDPRRKPTEVAIEQARLALREWLGGIYRSLDVDPAPQMGPEQLEATGRLGFHLTDGPERWSTAFLDTKHVPAEMAEAMLAAVRTSGPRLDISRMTPRDIDLGLTDVAEDTFEGLGKHRFIRYAILAVLVICVLGYFYRLLS
jgi:hypothetical protein